MNLRDTPPTDAQHEGERLAAQAGVTGLAEAPALPRLSRAEVRAGNRVYRRQAPWELPGRGGASVVTARWHWHGREQGITLGGAAAYRFRVGAFGGTLCLSAQAQARLLGEPLAHRLPATLRCVLLADALSDVAARLESRLQQPFEWVLPGDDAPSPPAGDKGEPGADARTFGIELQFDGAGSDRVDVAVRFDDDASLAACMAACSPRPALKGSTCDALALPLAFEFGRTVLSLSELRGIERGDIVAVERWQSHGSAFEAALVIGRRQRLTLRAVAEGRRATLQPWKEFGMTSLAHEAHAPESAPAAAPADRLETLEMPLRFEVGDLQLTLGELGSLQPGHVFELDQPLNRSTVRIYAHANLVGHGVLVAVGDRLGVRVTQIAADAHG